MSKYKIVWTDDDRDDHEIIINDDPRGLEVEGVCRAVEEDTIDVLTRTRGDDADIRSLVSITLPYPVTAIYQVLYENPS